jgi:hypothetical protein
MKKPRTKHSKIKFEFFARAFDFSGSLRQRVQVKTQREYLESSWGSVFWHLQNSIDQQQEALRTSAGGR